jgi:hypothetical protein
MWVPLLKNHGFKIIAFEPFMDERILRFWDTGFRPYFKELLTFVREHKEIMPEFKYIWVEFMKNYFFNFVNTPLEGKVGFILIVARKIKND